MRVVSILCICLILVSCAGRDARPVQVRQAGDEARTCQAITTEMVMIEQEVIKLGDDNQNKNTGNAIFGLTGLFLYIPLAFMDLSDAEKEEMSALRERYRYLAVIATDKGCRQPPPAQPGNQ